MALNIKSMNEMNGVANNKFVGIMFVWYTIQ